MTIMKKNFRLLLLIFIFTFFVACSKTRENKVSIGNISFSYDDKIWTLVGDYDENGPLEFKDEYDNSLIIFVTEETTYQHPLEMIDVFETLRINNESFKVFLQPTQIDVKGSTWYEHGYELVDGTTNYKVYQRFYGKYYNAINIKYVSNTENFDKSLQAAKELMSDVEIDLLSNEKNEDKAKKSLVGEWDLSNSGYLILNQNNTYEWYQDSSKDKNNYHFGTYGCDIESEDLAFFSFEEGEGFYLVLFLEDLLINGESGRQMGHKSDFLIKFDDIESDDYQMINMNSYKSYSMTRVK